MKSQRKQFPFLWQCISLAASGVRVRKYQYSQLFKDVNLCCARNLFLVNYNALYTQRSGVMRTDCDPLSMQEER
jgi:hypothetical protein